MQTQSPGFSALTDTHIIHQIKTCFAFRCFVLGLVYSLIWNGLWFVCTSFETISNTVSWYLPAAIRLFVFLVFPIRYWLVFHLLQHVGFSVFITLFPSPNFENFIQEQGVWLLFSFILSGLLFMLPTYCVRHYAKPPFLHKINHTLLLLSLAITVSTLSGLMVLFRQTYFGKVF